MRVPGLSHSNDRLMAEIRRDASLEQVANGATGRHALEEEMPEAYKDVQDVVGVVGVVEGFGISKKVARLRPIGVVKG
jgi:tRNA-splicing ligase RtcB